MDRPVAGTIPASMDPIVPEKPKQDFQILHAGLDFLDHHEIKAGDDFRHVEVGLRESLRGVPKLLDVPTGYHRKLLFDRRSTTF